MIVNAEHNNTFIAHHDDGDAYACIDGCVDKLERQLTEHKKKFRNRKHSRRRQARHGITRSVRASLPGRDATVPAAPRGGRRDRNIKDRE